MGNMSYCRFENTARNLEDCFDNWEDELEDFETTGKKRIIELARLIVGREGMKDNEEREEGGRRDVVADDKILPAVPDEPPTTPPRNARCIVCLGRVNEKKDLVECSRCGRLYHQACGKRVLSCVMCGAALSDDPDEPQEEKVETEGFNMRRERDPNGWKCKYNSICDICSKKPKEV